MERSIPIWLFLLFLLCWGLATVAFGWAVRATLIGNDRSGYAGQVAVEIAAFPGLAKQVLLEVLGYTSGDYADAEMRVAREPGADYSAFEPLPSAPGIGVDGPLIKADRGALVPGWRLVAGAFTIDGEMESAVLLLSPDLTVVKRWILNEVPVDDYEPRPKHLKFVHGIELLRDGSLIFTFDGSVSLQRFDSCGERLWTTGGQFHHAVNLSESGETVWTFPDFVTIAEVAVDDGEIVRQIPMDAVIAANPMTDILEIRRNHDNDLNRNSRNTEGEWLFDPFHLNDVEPLPSGLADRFDGFEAGDLLISARSLNLLFVLDPSTLKIKWWRIGMTQRQHDPDWLPSGEILVLNNRMSRDFSQVITIDPARLTSRVRLDGRAIDFYTRIRGKQQLHPDGRLVVSSTQQGRAFELNGDGDMVLELVNPKPGPEPINYVVSEMRWLPEEALDVENWQCPPAT